MAKLLLRRLLPDTLTWSIFTVLAGVVVLMSVTALVFFYVYRDDAGILASSSQATDQVIVVKRMIEHANPEDRARLVGQFRSPLTRFAVTSHPIVERSDNKIVSRAVLRQLRAEFRTGTDIRVDSLIENPDPGAQEIDDDAAHGPEIIEIPIPDITSSATGLRPPPLITREQRDARILREMQFGGPAVPNSRGTFRVSVKFAEDTWFNARMQLTVGEDASAGMRTYVLIETLVALTIALGALWGLGRAFRPLALFTAAAERLGVDFAAAPLPEDGPREVRRAAQAFNTMQMRLKRFVEDRTQMLAAISHDLRTPITRMRLRAEFVEDADQRAKMLRDLEDMEEMISATLTFSRDDAAREPAMIFDVGKLLDALATDARGAGQDVRYDGPVHCEVIAKPLSLKRALQNVLDNAVKYGVRARVSLDTSGDAVEVFTDDDGPGIPDADRERVFAPFIRLEASRSRETGGVGLGLTIARNTLRSMGGDIELRSRVGGGLRVRITLPKVDEMRVAAE